MTERIIEQFESFIYFQRIANISKTTCNFLHCAIQGAFYISNHIFGQWSVQSTSSLFIWNRAVASTTSILCAQQKKRLKKAIYLCYCSGQCWRWWWHIFYVEKIKRQKCSYTFCLLSFEHKPHKWMRIVFFIISFVFRFIFSLIDSFGACASANLPIFRNLFFIYFFVNFFLLKFIRVQLPLCLAELWFLSIVFFRFVFYLYRVCNKRHPIRTGVEGEQQRQQQQNRAQ